MKSYRVTLSRLVPDFSVRTWEIQREKSHKNEKVTVLTTTPSQFVSNACAVCGGKRHVSDAGLEGAREQFAMPRIQNKDTNSPMISNNSSGVPVLNSGQRMLLGRACGPHLEVLRAVLALGAELGQRLAELRQRQREGGAVAVSLKALSDGVEHGAELAVVRLGLAQQGRDLRRHLHVRPRAAAPA
eukprot:SAG31_NODE_512_length_14721_cov_17.995623_10_plen_186_part_00